MKQIVFRPKRYKMFLFFVGTIIFAIIGYFMAKKHNSFYDPLVTGFIPGPLTFLIGIFIVVSCGLSSFFFLFRFIFNKPSLTVDNTGINDMSSPFSANFIPTSNIAKVYSMGDWIAIEVRNYDLVFNLLSKWKKIPLGFFRYLALIWFKEENKNLFYIEKTYVDMDLEKAVNLINNVLTPTISM